MTVSEQGGNLTAGKLAARTPSLTEHTSCGEVFDWFIAIPPCPPPLSWIAKLAKFWA